MTKHSEICPENQRLHLLLHFISFVLLYFPSGMAWYWGNLVVYLNSYWFDKYQDFNIESPWVLSLFVIFWSITIMVGGYLIKLLDRYLITLIGVLIFDAGIFLSYLAVQHSLTAINLTLGVMAGIGFGFIQTETFIRITVLIKSKHGMAFAILSNFLHVGAIFLNLMITQYINPQNKGADMPLHRIKVFREKFIIERVPSIFIVLGITSSVLHLLGFALSFLLRGKYLHEDTQYKCEANTKTNEDGILFESTSLKKDIDIKKNMVAKQTLIFNTATSSSNPQNFEFYGQGENDTSPGEKRMGSYTDKVNHNNNDNVNSTQKLWKEVSDRDSDGDDLGPFQLLKSLHFYVLWYTVFATDMSCYVMMNFYKIFGELWIRDDHFLTSIGIAGLCVGLLMRIFWAMIIDATSVKTIQIILTASLSLTFLFYYLTPQVNNWLFAVWTCLITVLYASVYLNFPVATLKLFGKTHFGANYGLVGTSIIVLNIIAPFTLTAILSKFGWPTIFIGTAVLNILSLVANLVALPNRR